MIIGCAENSGLLTMTDHYAEPILDIAWLTGFTLMGYAGFGVFGAGFFLTLNALVFAAFSTNE